MDVDFAPELVGEGIRLRTATDADAATRASFGRSREINRAFGGDLDRDEPMTEDEARHQLRARYGPGPHWVIADGDDRAVGAVRLAPVDLANRSARFAIGLFDPLRLGRGIGSEATRLAVAHGFEELGLHRIALNVLADNDRAIAAYRKCGFVEEGRLRHTLWRDGEWLDDLVMAVLEEQYHAGSGQGDAVGADRLTPAEPGDHIPR